MCVASNNNNKCKTINRNKLGRAARAVLTRAKVEKRLICGLLPAISYLEKTPEDVLLCFLPQNQNGGDATTHIQTVLLQAFCYENSIPVIQVDNKEKFNEYCNITNTKQSDCLCAIIVKDFTIVLDNNHINIGLSSNEQFLMDFYECSLEEFPRPVVQLPR